MQVLGTKLWSSERVIFPAPKVILFQSPGMCPLVLWVFSPFLSNLYTMWMLTKGFSFLLQMVPKIYSLPALLFFSLKIIKLSTTLKRRIIARQW